ncbi:MAG: hypothetical protein CMJ48_15125 [Planctomycetaceae bacterium]|nr:hypothetical protein [Planctomycetaceae bacterium]
MTVVALLLSAYVGGYFGLGEHDRRRTASGTESVHRRAFPHAVLSTFYYPMGWIECRVRGEWVLLGDPIDTSKPSDDHCFEPPP